jgi:signal transduction histidine kinase
MFPEGSGLGLSIVKHAVEILEGRIGVKSEEEEGSIFWIEIPLI